MAFLGNSRHVGGVIIFVFDKGPCHDYSHVVVSFCDALFRGRRCGVCNLAVNAVKGVAVRNCNKCDIDCDECPYLLLGTVRRERMIRDDATQPPPDQDLLDYYEAMRFEDDEDE